MPAKTANKVEDYIQKESFEFKISINQEDREQPRDKKQKQQSNKN